MERIVISRSVVSLKDLGEGVSLKITGKNTFFIPFHDDDIVFTKKGKGFEKTDSVTARCIREVILHLENI